MSDYTTAFLFALLSLSACRRQEVVIDVTRSRRGVNTFQHRLYAKDALDLAIDARQEGQSYRPADLRKAVPQAQRHPLVNQCSPTRSLSHPLRALQNMRLA